MHEDFNFPGSEHLHSEEEERIPLPNDDFRFTGPTRDLAEEDRIQLTSVGVDIGSSTSLLIFSRLELERQDSRYVLVKRTILHESDILLTPYIDGTTIDRDTLGRFIDHQYEAAGLSREDVDTGALILTGVALLRQNARAIADLFAQEAGRFVAVSAGDNLETTMAAYGSGAVALSAEGNHTLINLDIGGGTTKIAVCSKGKICDIAAVDVGARLLAWDSGNVITRLEETGRRIGKAVGLNLSLGRRINTKELATIATYMVDRLFEVAGLAPLTEEARALIRTPILSHTEEVSAVTFSGGGSEFIYDRQENQFGDLGPLLAEKIKAKIARTGVQILQPAAGIRATVIGASQYTIQVSGSTIFISPLDVVPIRNIPVIAPDFALSEADIDTAAVRESIKHALNRFDLLDADSPVALAFRWQGSATYARIRAFCAGITAGMKDILSRGNPVVLVNDGDVGGLFGIHLKEDMHLPNPVISIDGIDLREFDYIDIGSLIPTSGAVPVVIKSLVFPASLNQTPAR
ncbi:MAG: ethanolamine ammonia-lyase reactivating factor EutA [Chloroflexi bacterium]|nr:ethanolamine ammonia-lyase reactivating factor EutA [Chloroflexota bacterium]